MFKYLFLFVLASVLFLDQCYAQDKDQSILLSRIKELVTATNNKKDSLEVRKSNAQMAYKLASKIDSDTLRVSQYLDISVLFNRLKDFDSFKRITNEAILLADKANDSMSKARGLSNFGIHFLERTQNDSAYYHLFEAKKIYDKLGKKYLKGKVLLNMAIVQKNVKDYIGSEVTTIEAIKTFSEVNDYSYFFSLYNNLGLISAELGRYEDAFKNHKRAFEYAKKSRESEVRQVISLNNLGLAYEKQKAYSKAILQYQKALKYQKTLGRNRGFYAIILDNIAYAKFRYGDLKNLPELFLKPLAICDSINSIRGKISINLHLAEYYKSIADTIKSLEHAQEVKLLSEHHDSNRDLLSSLLFLSKMDKAKEGLQYAQQYIALNDSLQAQERATRNQFARIRFETDEIEEQKDKVTKQKNWLEFGILGLGVLFILIFVIFKQQQHNKELLYAQRQQQANEEIYQLMLSQQAKLEEGREMEKRRVSEELHDGVLGRLFGTRLGLDGLNQRKEDDLAWERSKYIEELSSIEHEIRRISHDLSSSTFISEVAFVEVVEKLITEQCKVHKLQYEFENDPAIDWEEITDSVKINIYRIIQESLQNIAKHAKAKNIEIRFYMVVDKIKITILDDGIGFRQQNPKKGIGLKNITSRVQDIKGDVVFENYNNKGAIVSVTCPLPV